MITPKQHTALLETPSAETLHIKQLERKLLILYWIILLIGILTLIIFSLRNHLFDNIVLLPILGLVGYVFIRRLLVLPALTTTLLVLTNILKDVTSPQHDTLWNYLFYLCIFFSLTLLGSLCGYFLIKSIHKYHSAAGLRKAGILLFWTALAAFFIFLLVSYDRTYGNPVSAYYAQCCMQKYLKKNYPDCNVTLNDISYSFKTKAYHAKASMYQEDDILQPFNVYYTKSKVTDDYFSTYLEDQPTEIRIDQEVTSELTNLLIAHHIPFYTINCDLRLEKNVYDGISFDKKSFGTPLRLTFTLLTDTKQSYEDFESWCESIRSLLLSQGYLLDCITFKSSPHWEANSLAVTLTSHELAGCITDITSYVSFVDNGINNHLADSAANPTPYNNYYNNEELASKLNARFKHFTDSPLYISASSTSLGDLTLDFYWSGKRISVDSFANTVMSLFHTLYSENLLDGYSFQAISFKYGWGTSTESYEYTIYPENTSNQTASLIVDTLLKDQQY